MSADIDKERAAFESWALGNDFKIALREDGASPDKYFSYETEQRWIVWQAARATSVAALSPEGQAEQKPKLPHGHREDFYLMANARRIAMRPISELRFWSNAQFASELFATGSTSANEICQLAGIDPDGTKVQRIKAAAPQAAPKEPT